MTTEREDRIRNRAHEIWQREGQPHGRHDDHWQKAREEIEAEDGGSVPGRRTARKAQSSDAAQPKPRRAAKRDAGSDSSAAAEPKPARTRKSAAAPSPGLIAGGEQGAGGAASADAPQRTPRGRAKATDGAAGVRSSGRAGKSAKGAGSDQ